MSTDYPICPNCHYQRNEYDKLVHQAICPACGILYDKWSAQNTVNSSAPATDIDELESEGEHPMNSIWGEIKELFLSVPCQVDGITFYGRVLAFCVFFIWGWSFILGGIDWQGIGGSFIYP